MPTFKEMVEKFLQQGLLGPKKTSRIITIPHLVLKSWNPIPEGSMSKARAKKVAWFLLFFCGNNSLCCAFFCLIFGTRVLLCVPSLSIRCAKASLFPSAPLLLLPLFWAFGVLRHSTDKCQAWAKEAENNFYVTKLCIFLLCWVLIHTNPLCHLSWFFSSCLLAAAPKRLNMRHI